MRSRDTAPKAATAPPFRSTWAGCATMTAAGRQRRTSIPSRQLTYWHCLTIIATQRTRLYAGFDVAQASLVGGTSPTSSSDDAAQRFLQAGSAAERAEVVAGALQEKLARALGVEIDEIDVGKGLADYGVDSLMAVELRNWIRRDFGVSVAVFEIMDGKAVIRDIGASVEAKAERVDQCAQAHPSVPT
ncbi:hypothetical protein PFICI_08882 [Pestalotiopsis fici W106-1]|uniref:Carrier domain-containing protein n=1 Tax=Pestalotiopsis fici (strain W106-1 / CGMCC3.15140) TaxID=1229662 RepID=W3WZ17_PESFW|nr:uncharacterized protein PFICI_08882 [Pestalotiopsis fici W106-1]ETS79029.1 hypothetical protein PFICI_08882 [Pestalotiopsis fici W106-1]